MAAKENQGLQIAVMIFFLLVVILAVTTYVFFSQAEDRSKQVAGLQKEKNDLQRSANEIQAEANEYKQMMGYVESDTKETVEEGFKADMTQYSPVFENYWQAAPADPAAAADPADATAQGQKNYRVLATALDFEQRQNDKAKIDAEQDKAELEQRIAQLENTLNKKIDEYHQQFAMVSTEKEGLRSTFDDERTRFEKEGQQTAAKLDQLQQEYVAKSQEQDQKIIDLAGDVDTLRQVNDVLKQKQGPGEGSEKFEVADGQISWVDLRNNIVWVNLGSSDALRRQINFSVYSGDTSEAATAETKAKVEVTRILGEHLAEARILSDDLSNPIVPGDKVYSPVWERGRRDGFALAGFMDIDGDGRSDRDKIRNLITLNGGTVDAELKEDGDLVGQMKATTKYLVLGDVPTEKTKNSDIIANFSVITGQAQDLNIATISADRFVRYLGYHPEDRTVRLGKGARSEDFRPETQPEGGRRPGSTFRPRTRPASAY